MTNLNVGDKIELVNPMGGFRAVGTVCDVTSVQNDVVSFTCDLPNGCGQGCLSMDEFDHYFKKVETETCNGHDSRVSDGHGFCEDDVVELIKECDELPFDIGDRMIVQNIGHGAVMLTDMEDVHRYLVSDDLLVKHFNVIHEDDYEDDEELPAVVTNDHVLRIMNRSKREYITMFNQVVLAACKLPNGVILNAAYGFRTPEEFDFARGRDECNKQFEDKIWKFETYSMMNCHYNCAE